MMTFDEIMRRMLEVFPDAELGEDSDGQLVVYTGLVSRFTVTCEVYGPPDSRESNDDKER